MNTNKLNKIVREYLDGELDAEDVELREACSYVLQYGPLDSYEDWPHYHGWSSAIDALRDRASELPSEMWIDVEAEQVYDSEPEGWEDENGTWNEPEWSDYVHCDRRAIRRAVFGELADYM